MNHDDNISGDDVIAILRMIAKPDWSWKKMNSRRCAMRKTHRRLLLSAYWQTDFFVNCSEWKALQNTEIICKIQDNKNAVFTRFCINATFSQRVGRGIRKKVHLPLSSYLRCFWVSDIAPCAVSCALHMESKQVNPDNQWDRGWITPSVSHWNNRQFFYQPVSVLHWKYADKHSSALNL